jgi:hypothetical protein
MAALGRDGKPKKPNRFAHKTNQKGEAKREREREREREERGKDAILEPLEEEEKRSPCVV